MRTVNSFLLAGAMFLALGLGTFLYATFSSDRGDSGNSILIFRSPLYPAMMGLVLIVAGYAAALLSRSFWDAPSPA